MLCGQTSTAHASATMSRHSQDVCPHNTHTHIPPQKGEALARCGRDACLEKIKFKNKSIIRGTKHCETPGTMHSLYLRRMPRNKKGKTPTQQKRRQLAPCGRDRCSVLQCVAVCCSVLLSCAVCCSVLQLVAV